VCVDVCVGAREWDREGEKMLRGREGRQRDRERGRDCFQTVTSLVFLLLQAFRTKPVLVCKKYLMLRMNKTGLGRFQDCGRGKGKNM
jgi:hypothetical protein